MAAHHVVFVAGAAWQLLCESPMVLGAPLLHLDCCVDELDINGSCPFNATCRPDCYQLRFENGTTTCVRCKPESPSTLLYNISCVYSNETYFPSNASTTAPPQPKIGGPGVVASLLFGTLFISLFLILSVASFFYLKRSNKLPSIFYRRNKGSNDSYPNLISTEAKVRKKRTAFSYVNSSYHNLRCNHKSEQCVILSTLPLQKKRRKLVPPERQSDF
uniref:Chromosome 1 open reading frame 159 n=1 Tax=Erpetoichthys calabaricus TaxID=27687 RepID=A0A8C4RXW2_ERPCA